MAQIKEERFVVFILSTLNLYTVKVNRIITFSSNYDDEKAKFLD